MAAWPCRAFLSPFFHEKEKKIFDDDILIRAREERVIHDSGTVTLV